MEQQRYRSAEEMLVESLRSDLARDSEYAATYAQAALDEAEKVGDAAVFYLGIADMARAMDVIATATRGTGATGNAAPPTLDIVTIVSTLRALGLEIKIVPSDHAAS